MAEEFAELVGFLSDPKPEVQLLAAEGLLAHTESLEFLEFCRGCPHKVPKALLRLVERAEADIAANTSKDVQNPLCVASSVFANAGGAALQALVNLATVPTICNELIDLNAPCRCVEALRSGWLEGRAVLAHWHAMLLANLTTMEAAQEALCADESLLRFLFAAYVARPRPPARDGHEDPLQSLGKALGNICVLRQGRLIIAGSSVAAHTLNLLVAELSDRARRLDVLNIFRNLCIDTDCHAGLVKSALMIHVLRFVYPWEKADPERRNQLPDEFRVEFASVGAALTSDGLVRRATADCIVGLCQSVKGRRYLREHGCYEVVRAWHLEETDEETKSVIESTVPFVHYSEEEYEAMRGPEVDE